MRKINKIIVHCTATEYGKVRTPDTLLQRGYTKPNYHYIIQPTGEIEQIRPLDEVCHHCKGQNSVSIGVALVGGCKIGKPVYDAYPDVQIISAKKLLKMLRKQFPQAAIARHRDFNVLKDCPCISSEKFVLWFGEAQYN